MSVVHNKSIFRWDTTGHDTTRTLRSTEEIHGRSIETYRQFHGDFAEERKELDYAFHKNYTEERQLLQDKIIREFIDSAVVEDKYGQVCTTPTEPWIVFTAGAMGAGKSYTIRSLVAKNRFPLVAFVRVDPDAIRRELPEFQVYVDHDPETVGELTRKEAGLIAELLTLAALKLGRNVLVDGSLRDAGWYEHYFDQLRQDFPVLRIAIIHVTAPKSAIFQRAADRGIKTGRIIPKETLLNAYEQVPRSVERLKSKVDYHVELCNAPGAEDIEIVTTGEIWGHFQAQWMQVCKIMPNDSRRSILLQRLAFAREEIVDELEQESNGPE